MSHTARTMRKAADFIVSVDPAFEEVVASSPLCTIGRKPGPPPDHFSALVTSVIGQQLSVKAADTITARLHAHLAGNMTPEAVVLADIDELRSVGLSGAKTRTIKELAHAIHSGDLDLQVAADHEDDHTITAELTRLWGIGRWTAEMFLIFNMLRPDILPLDDLGLVKGISVNYFSGEPVSRSDAREVAANWEPWRTVATWYMWRSLDPIPVEY